MLARCQVGYFWLTLCVMCLVDPRHCGLGLTWCVMCVLYGGIYRVALRLHKAAEVRRSRMTASLVSAASQTITRIGIGMSTGSAAMAVLPLQEVDATPDDSDAPTMAVAAELHRSNARDDTHELTPTLPDRVESLIVIQTNDDDDDDEEERRNNEDERENSDATISCRAEETDADHAQQPGEITPLLPRSVDRSDRRSTFDSNNVEFAAFTSGADGSRLPTRRRTTASCRQSWLVVLPGLNADVEESWTREGGAAVDRRSEIATRHSVDVGRPRTRGGGTVGSSRRSLFEPPETRVEVSPAAATFAASSTSSGLCSDGFGCDPPPQSDCGQIVFASDEAEIVNDAAQLYGSKTGDDHRELTATSPDQVELHASSVTLSTNKQAQNTSAQRSYSSRSSSEHIPSHSADSNQLTIDDDDHMAVATRPSFVETRDELGADCYCDGEIVWTAIHDQEQVTPRPIEEHAPMKDDHVVLDCEQKSVRKMADRWRRAAKSRFAANRRLAHLRHWKLQRRCASGAQSTLTSSIDARQMPVSRPPLLSSPATVQLPPVYITISRRVFYAANSSSSLL